MVLMETSVHDDLLAELLAYENDPLGFVLYAFPWGEPGPLAKQSGPEEWQRELLDEVGQGLLTLDEAIQIAVASGHGIGKSAFVAWIILWGILPRETRGVVTANTESQLRTKTWAELGKWYNMYIGREFFVLTATALFSADKSLARTWRVDMVPWSEKNTEAFAGLHNQGKRILLIMDEGSAIPDAIWEVSEGALTDADTQIIWLTCGNPTRNSGRFAEIHQGQRTGWRTRRIDSRTVSFTNKKQIAKWAADYGEDSDFFRIRVKGELPRVGVNEFISRASVLEAMQREEDEVGILADEVVVIGVDVARYGDDESVIYPRRGRNGRLPYQRFSGISTMELVDRVLAVRAMYPGSLVAVDGGGVGGGVIDRLRQLGVDVVDVQFGAKAAPRGDAKYANKRAEIWGSLRDWIRGGLLPEDDPQLLEELTAPLYTIIGEDVIQLERKDAMRARGVASPNVADALAITFAVDTTWLVAGDEDFNAGVRGIDHNPYEGVRSYV